MADTQLILKPVGPPPDVNISELARRSKLSRATVRRRLADGWSPDDLLPVEATVEAVEIPQRGHDVATHGHPAVQQPGRYWILGGISSVIFAGLLTVGLLVNTQHYWSLARDGAICSPRSGRSSIWRQCRC